MSQPSSGGTRDPDPSAANDAHWRAWLAGDDPTLPAYRRRMRMLPSSPRCKMCLGPWEKNPRYCRRCWANMNRLGIGGVELDVSLVFADIRGSTGLAEQLDMGQFSPRGMYPTAAVPQKGSR